jgi:hypothetical protein
MRNRKLLEQRAQEMRARARASGSEHQDSFPDLGAGVPGSHSGDTGRDVELGALTPASPRGFI